MGINQGDDRHGTPSLPEFLARKVRSFYHNRFPDMEGTWEMALDSVRPIAILVDAMRERMCQIIAILGVSYVYLAFPGDQHRAQQKQEQREDDLDACIEKGWKQAYSEVFRAVALWADNDPEHRTQIMSNFLSACLADKASIRSSVHYYQKENPGFSSPEVTAYTMSFDHMQNIAEAHSIILRLGTRVEQ